MCKEENNVEGILNYAVNFTINKFVAQASLQGDALIFCSSIPYPKAWKDASMNYPIDELINCYPKT